MTPNELRLGNYVRIKSNGEIVKVVSLTPQEVGYHYNAKNPICFHRKCSEIEPVLIHEVHDSLPHIPDLDWMRSETYGNLYYYKDSVLIYLHELQNAYFVLMGDELKIEL